MFALWTVLLLAAFIGNVQAANHSDCDREMRKTLESIQAWRRQHNGEYPSKLADLRTASLLPANGGICPAALAEAAAADGSHGFVSSVGDGADPAGSYEYELSNTEKWKQDKAHLPGKFPRYTRQDIKVELLRRPFFEQIPILRCRRHRLEAPIPYREGREPFRNTPVTGVPFWDGELWEQNWLSDVPYCARDVNVIFGLKGPPFYADRSPKSANALDLREWNCAFGDHPWWWTYPMFGQGTDRQTSPHLQPFFQEQHGREIQFGGQSWWLNGLVQLQGRFVRDERNTYIAPTLETFVWERTNLSVFRMVREASWLQGTVWTGREGETTGWLVWRYVDGKAERVPLIYGKATARFWGDLKQIGGEKGFPDPVWKHHETAEAVGKERWLRLYQQTWINPRPEVMVKSLDFVSNRDCPASPFLVAVNLTP